MNRLALRYMPLALALAGFALVSLQLELTDRAAEPMERPLVVAVSAMARSPVCSSQPHDARISCISHGRGLRD